MAAPRKHADGSQTASALLDLSLALALPLSTQIARLTGKGRDEVEQARASQGALTPASGAFAIWAPIFLSVAAYGVQRVRFRGHAQDGEALALARASLAGNILWSLNAQFKGFGWQSAALLGVSALTATAAVAKFAKHPRSAFARSAAQLLAPLAGWLSVATFVNVETSQRATDSRTQKLLKPRMLLSAASAAAVAGVTATRGNPLYAGAVAWGLGAIALKNARRDPKLAVAAVTGMMEMAVAVFAPMKKPVRRSR